MLHTLHLKNFKQHEDLTVDFSDGLNVITGPNYSGKTTLLEAVNFALWGVSTVPGGSSVALRRGANQMAVELTFSVDGSHYRIRRTQSGATLYRGEEAIAKSQSVVSTELERLLGISKKRFMQLKYGQQSETKALLTLGAPELHRIIEDLSGVELVNKVLARTAGLASNLKAVLEQLPEYDLSIERDQVETSAASVADLEQRLSPVQERVEEARAVLSVADQELKEARQHNQRVRDLQKRRADAEAKLQVWQEREEEAQQDLARCLAGLDSSPESALEEAEQTWQACCDELADLETEERDFHQADRRRQNALDAARKYDERVKQMQEQLSNLEFSSSDLEGVEAEYAKQMAELEGTNRHIDMLEKGLQDAMCPQCKRPFEDHDPEQMQQELQTLRGTKEDLVGRVRLLRDSVAEIRHAVQKAGSDQAILDRAQKDYTAALAEHGEALEELRGCRPPSDIQDAMASLRRRKDELMQDCRQLSSLVDKIDSLKQGLEKCGDNVAYLRRTLNDIPLPDRGEVPEDILDSRCESAHREVQQATDQLNAVTSELRLNQERLSNLRQRLQEHEEANVRRTEAQDELATVQQLQKYLRDNRDRFVAGVWAGLLRYASAFLSTATGGFLSSLTRSEDGEFIYTMDDFEMPVAAASGAQKSIMGLAVQAALAQLLPSGFHCVMLDEPTADMDPDHALAVSTLLASMGGQCLMVSHRELDSSIANHCVQLGVQ